MTNLQGLVSKHLKNTVIVNTAITERLFHFFSHSFTEGAFPVLFSQACSLIHVVLLLSNQPITFHTKQLSFSVLKY